MNTNSITEQQIYGMGQHIGGAVGEGIDAGCNAYNAFQDGMSGNWTGVAEQAGDALVNGAEAYNDGRHGKWIN